MMKFREIIGVDGSKASAAGTNNLKKAVSSENSGFLETLGAVRNADLKSHLTALLSRIQDQGKRLSDKMDISELRLYKKLISEFLNEAVSNSHRFSKENYLDRRGRHKVYAIVKRVNENLDLLTEEFMKEEKDNLKVLQRIDDIRGLLLDIVT